MLHYVMRCPCAFEPLFYVMTLLLHSFISLKEVVFGL